MKIFQKSNNDLGSMYIVYESPVRNEGIHLKGVSHLLEHMICCNLSDLEEPFDQHCLDCNAYTGEDEVVFHVSGLSEELAKFRQIFAERVLSYRPQAEHLEKERGIVLQEFDDSYAEAYFSSYTNYVSMKHGYVGPVGVRSAIEAVTLEQVCEFYDQVFSKPSRIIIIDREDAEINTEYASTTGAKYVPCRYLNLDAPVVPSSINLLNASPFLPEAGIYHLGIINAVLGEGQSSPLYRELVDKAELTHWISIEPWKLNDDHLAYITTSVAKSKVKATKEIILSVLSNPARYFTRERFDAMMQNSRIARKISDQNLAEEGYIQHLASADERISFAKNLDKISYESALDYYNRYLNPVNVQWDQLDEREIRKMK